MPETAIYMPPNCEQLLADETWTNPQPIVPISAISWAALIDRVDLNFLSIAQDRVEETYREIQTYNKKMAVVPTYPLQCGEQLELVNSNAHGFYRIIEDQRITQDKKTPGADFLCRSFDVDRFDQQASNIFSKRVYYNGTQAMCTKLIVNKVGERLQVTVIRSLRYVEAAISGKQLIAVLSSTLNRKPERQLDPYGGPYLPVKLIPPLRVGEVYITEKNGVECESRIEAAELIIPDGRRIPPTRLRHRLGVLVRNAKPVILHS